MVAAAPAAAICARCPVQEPCLAYAHSITGTSGIWGGTLFIAVGTKTARTRTLGRACAVPGCPKPVVARGWCRSHYQRWRTHGRPTDDEPVDQNRQRCSHPGCPRFVNAKGFCSTHEKQAERNGVITRRPPLGPVARFAARCVRTDDGCLVFQGGSDEYGQFVIGGKHLRPRRFAWENATGKTLPRGAELKARCGNPRCCEPSHLYVSRSNDTATEMTA